MFLSIICSAILASIFLALINALQKARNQSREPVNAPQVRDQPTDPMMSFNTHFATYWESIVRKQMDELRPDPMETVISDEIGKIVPATSGGNGDQPTTSGLVFRPIEVEYVPSPLRAMSSVQPIGEREERQPDHYPCAESMDDDGVSEHPVETEFNPCTLDAAHHVFTHYRYKSFPLNILRNLLNAKSITFAKICASIEHSVRIVREISSLDDTSDRPETNITMENSIITRIYRQQVLITNGHGPMTETTMSTFSWIPIAHIGEHIICVPPNAPSLIAASSCGMRAKCMFLVLTAIDPLDPNCALFNAFAVLPLFTSNFAGELKRMYVQRELTGFNIANDIIVNIADPRGQYIVPWDTNPLRTERLSEIH